jgi:hypothetical protein
MSREQALEAVQGAHGMLITCLHDLTSTVTAEELTLGLLIVCLDRCGFTELMDETCGVKIAVTTPYKVIVSMV